MANRLSLALLIAIALGAFYFSRPEAPSLTQLNLIRLNSTVKNPHITETENIKNIETSSLLKEVSTLEDTDQAGLDILYEKAQLAIKQNPSEWTSLLTPVELRERSLLESFFLLSAWIRYSEAPHEAVLAFLRRPMVRSDRTTGHHEVTTPAVKERRLLAYALAKLRKKWRVDGVRQSTEKLAEALIERARTDKSLDVSIEAFKLLKLLVPAQLVIEVLQSRSADERELISAVL
jgi:hypothetical protein